MSEARRRVFRPHAAAHASRREQKPGWDPGASKSKMRYGGEGTASGCSALRQASARLCGLVSASLLTRAFALASLSVLPALLLFSPSEGEGNELPLSVAAISFLASIHVCPASLSAFFFFFHFQKVNMHLFADRIVDIHFCSLFAPQFNC